MLLGLTEPTSGQAEVAGFDPLRDPLEVKRRVGYLPDQIGFYEDMSARDNLAYTGRLAGLSRREIDERFAAALDRVGLGDVGRARVATFSQGMRQRLGLAEILMKRPSVAILDEPTTALDPHSTQEFLDMIRGLKADGTAVLLSSHHLDQVQSVCDRVALFNRGTHRAVRHGDRAGRPGARRRPCHRCRGARRRMSPSRLAAIPGVVRVQPLGRRPLTGSIASAICAPRSPASSPPTVELTGIHFAAPSLNEVYTRYFAEARDAVSSARPLRPPRLAVDRARHRRRQGDRGPSVERAHAHPRGAGVPDRDRRRLCGDPPIRADDRRKPVPVPAPADDGAGPAAARLSRCSGS